MERALVSFGDASARVPTAVAEGIAKSGLQPVWINGEGGDLAIVTAAASKAPSLAAEVIRFRPLLIRVHESIREANFTGDLLAELEREVKAIRAEGGP